jgi:hypothetical protein
MSDVMTLQSFQLHDQPGWSQDTRLWLGILGGPAAWLIHFNVNYLLAWVACASGSNFWLHVTTALCIAITLAALLASLQTMGPAREEHGDYESRESRRRFMGMTGVMSSMLFGLIIIAQAIAVVMVVPCPD